MLELIFVFGTYALTLAVCPSLGTQKSGSLASAGAGLIILLALRNNVATIFFGISFERALFFHKLGAVLVLALAIIHGYLALIRDESFQLYNEYQDENTDGMLLLAMMVSMSLLYGLKNFFFEYFYIVHVLFYALIIPVAIVHGATVFALAALLWAFDLFLRYILCVNKVTATAQNLVGDVVKITMKKPFTYSAGQYCFVMIPSLSVYQFHPFSLSSAPHEEEISLHIRVLGNWTSRLKEHVDGLCRSESKERCEFDVYLEGPFGLPSIDLESADYSVVLLISGGIGVTPTQSIYNHLLHQHCTGQRIVRKCVFVWSVRDRAMVTAWDIEQSPGGGIQMKQNKTQDPSNKALVAGDTRKKEAAAASDSSLAAGGAGGDSRSVVHNTSRSKVLPLSFQPGLIIMDPNAKELRESYAKDGESSEKEGQAQSQAQSQSSTRALVPVPSRPVSFSFLNTLQTPDPFHCEFYLTALRSKDEFKVGGAQSRCVP